MGLNKHKDNFLKACELLEAELLYRLGLDEEGLRVVEEYFHVKHEILNSGGIAYKHGLKKLEQIKTKIYEL